MDIRKLISNRFGGEKFGLETGEYKFGKIKSAKEQAMKTNPSLPIIDLGIGEPDGMANKGIIEKLYEEAQKYENRVYADEDCKTFRIAAADYMKKIYRISNLDPDTEISHALGAKNAIAFLPPALINEGDYVLMPSPAYPVLEIHSLWWGAKIHHLPLKEENNFLPELDNIPKEVLKKAKMIYINYPNNPTGAIATKEFYRKLVDFAKENNIIIVSDPAYGVLNFQQEPLSIFEIKDAKDIAIEVHSLSKSFNMTGWRLAFIVGNKLIMDLFKHSKSNYDSGQFLAIQKAGIYALEHPELSNEIKEKYYKRHEKLVKLLNSIGFSAKMPGGTFFLYVKSPKGVKNGPKFNSGEDFSQYLIKKLHISTVPWDEEGPFVRFSVTFELGDKTENDIFKELKSRLSSVEFAF